MSLNSLLAAARRRKTVTLVGAAAVLTALAVGGAALAQPSTAEASPARAAADPVSVMNEHLQVRAALGVSQTALTDAAAVNADVKSAGVDLGVGKNVVDATGLQNAHDVLAKLASDDKTSRSDLAVAVTTYAERVETDASALRTNLNTAIAQRQAAQAAQAAAEALAAANTPDGARATARQIAADQYGWGDGQFECLNSLWNKESGWNYQAYNDSGATGIPQALPGGKMASAGDDWETSAATQVRWGLGYIANVYGTPCSAWGHSQATNWY